MFGGGEQGRQELTGFSKADFVEEKAIRGRFGTDVDGASVTLGLRGETGGGLNRARRADGEKDSAAIEGGKDAVEFEGNFAKPADMRTDSGAARAARKFGRRFAE